MPWSSRCLPAVCGLSARPGRKVRREGLREDGETADGWRRKAGSLWKPVKDGKGMLLFLFFIFSVQSMNRKVHSLKKIVKEETVRAKEKFCKVIK